MTLDSSICRLLCVPVIYGLCYQTFKMLLPFPLIGCFFGRSIIIGNHGIMHSRRIFQSICTTRWIENWLMYVYLSRSVMHFESLVACAGVFNIGRTFSKPQGGSSLDQPCGSRLDKHESQFGAMTIYEHHEWELSCVQNNWPLGTVKLETRDHVVTRFEAQVTVDLMMINSRC